MKLVLSADFELKKVRDLLGQTAIEAYPVLEGQYALVDTFQEATYLVNESIYYFLSLFSTPASVSEVCASLGGDASSRKHIENFIADLRKKEILVSEAHNDEILACIEQEQELPPVVLESVNVHTMFKHTRQVWVGLVSDDSRPEPYVLKKMLFPPALSDEERDRRIKEFTHEVSMHQAAGDHRNIVTLYGTDMDRYEMMLEYVEGTSIRKFVQRHNPPLCDQYILIDKILSVFTHLHKNGVLHGDIHSSNFLVTIEKEPVLLDFDMARSVGSKGAKATRIGGVYPYAPPERISTAPLEIFNRKQTTRTAEVYQLGIICYLILYHELPFEGATWKNLAGSILDLRPVWKPQTPSGEVIPDAVIETLGKALEKKPAARYPSVQAFTTAWKRSTNSLRMQQVCN